MVVAPAAVDEDDDFRALMAAFREVWVPNRALVISGGTSGHEARASQIPSLRGKRAIAGRTTAYVCENRVCKYPTSDPAEFKKQLLAVRRLGAEADAPGDATR